MQAGSPDRWPRLTARQHDVLQHLLSGLADKRIAAALHISPHTVHNHVKALFRAFGVSSRPELFARCLELHAANERGSPWGDDEPVPGAGAWPAPVDSAQTILQNAPDFILEIERDGTIQFINRVYPIHRREDVIGSKVAQWIAPEEVAGFMRALRTVYATGEPQACEHTIPSLKEMGISPRFQMRLSAVEEGGRTLRVIAVDREVMTEVGAAESTAR